jgi:hypothetical protein
MTSSTRQNSLLVAEDWKKIYTTFREADFQSYDFETLRKSMIDYLRLYYPEDFNDFIESSEYIALIDLIAFMGQSLAFRTDLNARENFLDTAERRDSILKLARLVNYSPKRSTSASGLLKITSASTTEVLFDSNGINLSNLVVSWNDTTNSNWQEQIQLVLNATLLNSQTIGKPGNSQVINGIKTDEYTVNITSNTIPVYPFTAAVNGAGTQFEVVSATTINQSYIYEVNPKPTGKFNFLYRNDNQGNASNNTGFFLYFKQGSLQSVDFNLAESVPNRVLNVGYNNINNTDIWLYNLTATNVENNLWKSVPTVAGTNIIYNKTTDRNLYQVNTKAGDQIDLVFGDGSFSNIPQGPYRIRFRTSNAQTYKITPDEMQGVTISLNYVSRAGNLETLTVRANLTYSVTNATGSESLTDIKLKAPQQYYTQGRMITGEDYNIVPYTAFNNILKVKAVNRTSSGVSRFLDINDSTGKYSSTNIFGEDGYLYKEAFIDQLKFTSISSANIKQIVEDDLTTVLASKEILHFFYDKNNFTRHSCPNTNWSLVSLNTNGSTGYFTNPTSTTPLAALQLGYTTSATQQYIRLGAILKFKAPTGSYFNAQNQIVVGTPSNIGDKMFIYASVRQVIGDGTNGGSFTFVNGQGPVTLSQKVPTGAIIADYGIIPVFKNSLPQTLIQDIVNRISALTSFGLRYDLITEGWTIIEDHNLDIANSFSIASSGTTSDSSWVVRFKYSINVGYTLYWRGLRYIFESAAETKFYFDEKVKIYDSKTATIIQDQIKVLKINTGPDTLQPLGIDYSWFIYKNIVDVDGYENQNKVLVTYTDTNVDGIPDNPDVFDIIVNPDNIVFFEQQINYDSFILYVPVNLTLTPIQLYSTLTELQTHLSEFLPGQIFYTSSENAFWVLNTNGVTVTRVYNYIANVGRGNLYFQYRHNSPSYRRIDPSPNNIIDLYMLTNTYSTDYGNWIRDTTNTLVEPDMPTTDELKLEYSSLENYKAISDTIIFNSAKFKPLFGAKAVPSLQAIFKVVKNVAFNTSDNDIKSSVTNAINTYFAVENWDFGETFYFSELSAYLHTALSPNVSSIIIVPTAPSSLFGSLYQINAESNEILTSAATIDNVEIISAITAAQINANFAGVNSSITFGTT